MDEGSRAQLIENRRRLMQLWDVVYSALFICDIERDKVPFELTTSLNQTVDNLSEKYPPESGASFVSSQKISIRKETIEKAHSTVMGAIKEGFQKIGMKEFESSALFKQLEQIVLKILEKEKMHREAEYRYRQSG